MTLNPEIIISSPELHFEISECNAPLETIIELVERNYPGWTFDRTESRYESCLMAIFTNERLNAQRCCIKLGI